MTKIQYRTVAPGSGRRYGMDKTGGFKTETFPVSRIATFDVGVMGLQKHHVKALIELDVTKARKKIRELQGN